MKNIICSFFLIALCIIPYSCKKKGADPDPIKPPIDTIPNVDTNYLKLLDTVDHVRNMAFDTNYLLKNKSLDTIRYYMNGKWQLRSLVGGFSGLERFYPEHSFVEFLFNTTTSEDSVRFYSDVSTNFTTRKVIWKKEYSIQGDTTYLFNYYNTTGTVPDKIINSLKNDTLITTENFNNGFLNLYSKVR